MIRPINNEEFNNVIESNKRVLVDFYADRCGVCRRLTPVVEEIIEENDSETAVTMVDTDETPELAEKYGVSSIPALLLFDNGKVVKKSVGYKSKKDILSFMN